MDSSDFNKLIGLLSKLAAATDKATREDGSFKRFHQNSVTQLKELPQHLKRIEQGLRTAKIIK